MKSVLRVIAGLAGSLLLCGVGAADEKSDKPSWPQERIKTLEFRCSVIEGPKLTACKPLKAEKVDPRTVEYSKAAVEGLESCKIDNFKPGTKVTYAYPYVDDPNYLDDPISPHVIKRPDYAEPPPLALIKRLYPEQAKGSGVTGRAVIACRVGLDGRATDCKIAEETPAGLGFGEAGLIALKAFRFTPKLYDCRPVDDGNIRMPIVFSPR